jgi:glycolate oxidase FAD binding subunit
VAERAERMCGLLGARAMISADPPPWWGRGAGAPADGTLIRIAFWAGQLAAVLAAADAAAAAAGLDPAVSGSAAAGVIYAAADASAGPAALASFVTALRTALSGDRAGGDGGVPAPGSAPVPGSAVILHAPAEVRAAVDIWGPVPSLGLMRSVKDQFDPEHRMAPGRFAGGI